MTKQELIDHLEHLAEYVKYSEDAPALREAIKMLKCSEMPNGSEEHTQERTETRACDCIAKGVPIEQEPLTDKEQRIFLAAMSREEKVCKQVDEECRDCREPYEDSLVRTCHEITRKVKGALWT